MNIEGFKEQPLEDDFVAEEEIEQTEEGEGLMKAQERAGELFDECEAEELVPKVLEELKHVLDSGRVDKEAVIEAVQNVDVNEKEAFVESVTDAIRPIIDFMDENPKDYEELRRNSILERGGNEKINDLIYYNKTSDGNIHIHVAPNKQTSIGEKIRFMKEGIEELAKIVQQDEGIKEVTATSWIVAEAPGLMERLGFELQGEISEEFKEAQFSEEDRPVHHASISRENIIEKYLSS